MRRIMQTAAYAAPFVIIAALIQIYLLAPDFYLRYVLEFSHRESQAVEIATVLCLVVAIVPLAWSARRLWRDALRRGATMSGWRGLLDRFGSAGFVSLILLATIFFLGEEINWGQTIKLWLDPKAKLPVQTNVHNNIPGISVQGLGSMAMAGAFFGVPLVWLLRRRLNLPASLRPAVAEGPVICALAVAMSWKWVKDLYTGIYGRARDDAFYWGFVEQINEQKELLVALSLMLYALYRVPAVSHWIAAHRTFEAPPAKRETPALVTSDSL